MCAALAVAAIVVLAAAANASAGDWVQVSCVNPNQTAAGSAGWSGSAAGGGYGSDNDTGCGPGSPMLALLSTDAAVAVGSTENLHYVPPAGSTLAGGQLDVGMYADGYGQDASGTAVAYTPEYAYDGSNVFFQCAAGLTPCAPGSNDFTGQLEVPAGRGGNLYLSAGCGGTPGQSCDEGGSNGGWSVVELWWANLRLSNTSTPASNGMNGTLLDPGARGTQELTFTATDFAGPGVYSITVQGDGQTLYSGTPDSNDGLCTPVGTSGSALMFDASQPCKQIEAVDLPVDTTALADGQHTLKVTVTDAAQNSSVVYDGTISTDNAPADTSPPAIATAGQLLPGSTLSAQHGEWSAPTGAGTIAYSYQWQDCDGEGSNCKAIPGAQAAEYTATASDIGHSLRVLVSAANTDGGASLASAPSTVVSSPPAPAPSATGVAPIVIPGVPNGTNASEAAQAHIAGRAAISRAYPVRAFTVSGQLLSDTGTPIAGATLDVREQIQGASSAQVIGHVSTAATGAFSVRVPAGPSRVMLIDYQAFSTDAGYTAQASVQEHVTAAVQLQISPRRTSPSGRITLSGIVRGAIPPQGVVVEMLVHYRGRWEPFRDPRTNRSGRFRVTYQFEGAVGRFPFRAEVLGGQAGFPYTHGESSSLDVSTN
jgi:hypothetical protein